jgi:hypothetical protein
LFLYFLTLQPETTSLARSAEKPKTGNKKAPSEGLDALKGRAVFKTAPLPTRI